jgi:hypothetical protein
MQRTKGIADTERQSSFLMERSTFVYILMGCLMVGAWLSNHSVGAAAQAPRPTDEQSITRTITDPAAAAVPFDSAADAQAFEKDRQIQMEAVAKREQVRLKREEAASKMAESKEYYQFFLQDQWNEVIYAHLPAFDSLRLAAAQSNTGSVPCKICNAHGKLDSCILCKNSGKCVSCNGTGALSSDKTCPTCLGTGHCFLCGGTGKMTCPFCDDGEISAHQHEPSTVLPIH